MAKTAVETKKYLVKRVLVKKGSYKPEMDVAIGLLAVPLASMDLIASDVCKLNESFATSITREGNLKIESHPAIKIQKQVIESCTTLMRLLGLAWDDFKDVDPDDELDDLEQSVKSAEHG